MTEEDKKAWDEYWGGGLPLQTAYAFTSTHMQQAFLAGRKSRDDEVESILRDAIKALYAEKQKNGLLDVKFDFADIKWATKADLYKEVLAMECADSTPLNFGDLNWRSRPVVTKGQIQ